MPLKTGPAAIFGCFQLHFRALAGWTVVRRVYLSLFVLVSDVESGIVLLNVK